MITHCFKDGVHFQILLMHATLESELLKILSTQTPFFHFVNHLDL